jgi:ParB family chromosome partitioning protein
MVDSITSAEKVVLTSPLEAKIPEGQRIWTVPVERIKPSPFQPRREFDKVALEELAQSIRVHGILQPIVGRKLKNGTIELISGERRWRAAQMAGLFEVPVILKEKEDMEVLQLAIIENIQREDLNPIDEALSYLRLIEEFALTQAQVAEKVGRERSSIANSLRLLSLPEELKDFVARKQLSVGHAKVLLGLQDKDLLIKLAHQSMDEKWSVRNLEQKISSLLKGKGGKNQEEVYRDGKGGQSPSLESLAITEAQRALEKKFSTQLKIDYHQGKGAITIFFHSKDQFDSLLEVLQR